MPPSSISYRVPSSPSLEVKKRTFSVMARESRSLSFFFSRMIVLKSPPFSAYPTALGFIHCLPPSPRARELHRFFPPPFFPLILSGWVEIPFFFFFQSRQYLETTPSLPRYSKSPLQCFGPGPPKPSLFPFRDNPENEELTFLL